MNCPECAMHSKYFTNIYTYESGRETTQVFRCDNCEKLFEAIPTYYTKDPVISHLKEIQQRISKQARLTYALQACFDALVELSDICSISLGPGDPPQKVSDAIQEVRAILDEIRQK